MKFNYKMWAAIAATILFLTIAWLFLASSQNPQEAGNLTLASSKLLRPEGLTAWAVNSEPFGARSEAFGGFSVTRTPLVKL